MKVIDKCREYCKRMSTSQEHYKFLLGEVWISPALRDKECGRPDCLCENCDLNRFSIARANMKWEWMLQNHDKI